MDTVDVDVDNEAMLSAIKMLWGSVSWLLIKALLVGRRYKPPRPEGLQIVPLLVVTVEAVRDNVAVVVVFAVVTICVFTVSIATTIVDITEVVADREGVVGSDTIAVGLCLSLVARPGVILQSVEEVIVVYTSELYLLTFGCCCIWYCCCCCCW